MKNQLLALRIFLIAMSIVGAITAGALCQVTAYGRADQDYSGNMRVFTSIPVDGSADGAAAGFGAMSGLALVALSITFLRKEQ